MGCMEPVLTAVDAPQGAPSHNNKSLYIVITLLLAAVIALAIWVWMLRLDSPEILPSPTPSVMVETEWEVHIDAVHGFSFWYPRGLEGRDFTSETGNEDVSSYHGYTAPNGESGTIGIVVFSTPLTQITTLYSGPRPFSDFPSITLDGRVAYFHSDGDAGCGGTTYYIPLTDNAHAELTFGDCEGQLVSMRPDISAVLQSFKFSSEPGPAPSYPPQGGVTLDRWDTFSSEHFTLSFKVPPGFVVTDRPDSILVSYGPLHEFEIGSDNAFFRLIRYAPPHTTKQNRMDTYRAELSYPVEYEVVVDGFSFPSLSGTDKGRYEGLSAGTIVAVFFDASWVEYQQRPGGGEATYDTMNLGRFIVDSMVFRK